MKKIFTLGFLLIIPLALSAQWFGDGLSAGTAYYGVINTGNTMQAWNLTNYPGGVIYVGRSASGQNDLEVGSGGILNIGPGITVKFCTTTSDLRITGSGVLNASGSSSAFVTFTKDLQATWGHITFDDPSGTGISTLNYCIIENGLVSGSGYPGSGGGILIRQSHVTISNSIIKNNYAAYGGGIFIDNNQNPYIYRCLFQNNTCLHGGGGIYCYNGASSVIENCIFDSNQCLEPTTSYYTGGGVTAQTACSIKVLNCTFVNNTSTRPEGQSLLLHSSPNSRVINSILWGTPAKQIYCYGTTPASVIINCAYRGITSSSGTPVNPKILNSSNTAVDGPNFTATDGSDWSIMYASPCRDAGVNTYTGVTIPPLDYEGNARVNTTDIGAYESLYSTWKTTAATTDWTLAANWTGGVPVNKSNVFITTGGTNYPTGSPNQDFIISTGRLLVLEQGTRLTLNNLTNNGTLKLNSSAAGFASLIINSYNKGSGATEEIQMFLAGGGTASPLSYKWHYIASPVSSLAVSTFSPSVTLDLAQWVESYPALSLSQGWVAYDGYIYSTGGMGGPTFTTLVPGKGYDYYKNADHTFTFGGQLNTSDVSVSLDYTSGDNNMHGYNLIGNPFCSGLDWDYIVSHSFPANTTKSLYYTRNSALCSYINGVGVPGDVNGIIPPMQGFFSKTSSAGNTMILPAAARTNGNIHPTYKALQVIPLVRLSLTDDTLSDETVVRFDDLANPGLDNDFDAVKMFLSPDLTSICSSMSGTNYAIDGLPFPDPSVEIPVTINLTTDAPTRTISATQIQGLDNYDVTLIDNTTGLTADLKTDPNIMFAAAKGNIAGRFILKIGTITTGIENPTTTLNKFNIYSANNKINIQSLADEWEGKTGSVEVMALTGKTISNTQNVEFHKNSLTQVDAPQTQGIYIVQIKSGMMRFAGKVVIR
jgi:predicted outer membrane repeat protein